MGLVEIILGVIALIAAAFGIGSWQGRKTNAKKEADKKIREYNETSKKLNEVRPAPSADAARSRLRTRDK